LLDQQVDSTFPRINWTYVTTYETDNFIKSLKSKNSYGYDEISLRMILALQSLTVINGYLK